MGRRDDTGALRELPAATGPRMPDNAPPPLAQLTTADLDPTTLAALFADLRAYTEVVEVQVKGGATAYAGNAGLDQAESQLLAGVVRAIQVRYRWQGQAWMDTLMRLGDGRLRIVRCSA